MDLGRALVYRLRLKSIYLSLHQFSLPNSPFPPSFFLPPLLLPPNNTTQSLRCINQPHTTRYLPNRNEVSDLIPTDCAVPCLVSISTLDAVSRLDLAFHTYSRPSLDFLYHPAQQNHLPGLICCFLPCVLLPLLLPAISLNNLQAVLPYHTHPSRGLVRVPEHLSKPPTKYL